MFQGKIFHSCDLECKGRGMSFKSSGSIFEEPAKKPEQPLAARLRPKSLEEIIGHEEYLRADGLIGSMVASKRLSSLLFSGPPGVGKTSIARVVASQTGCRFVPLVATSLGIKEIKAASVDAERSYQIQGINTVIFIDEIHRLTKIQSDALLFPVEEGTFILIGATTENPWMEVSPALLSRFLVVELLPVGHAEVSEVLDRAMSLTGAALVGGAADLIQSTCGGDLRSVLNTFEGALALASRRGRNGKIEISEEDIRSIRKTISNGLSVSEHYEMTSALIKSMRASDVNAALYWLARLLVSGEDPRFVARRLLIFASEDIGLADSNALAVAHAAMGATERIGMPEVRINLGHCVAYLAFAPKSKASYEAIDRAIHVAGRTMGWPVPEHLRGVVSEIEVTRGKSRAAREIQSGFPKGLAEVEFFKLNHLDESAE